MEKFNLKDFKCSSQAQLPEMLSATHDTYTISKTHSSGPKKNPLNKVSAVSAAPPQVVHPHLLYFYKAHIDKVVLRCYSENERINLPLSQLLLEKGKLEQTGRSPNCPGKGSALAASAWDAAGSRELEGGICR